jgi:hypothetical protein
VPPDGSSCGVGTKTPLVQIQVQPMVQIEAQSMVSIEAQ